MNADKRFDLSRTGDGRSCQHFTLTNEPYMLPIIMTNGNRVSNEFLPMSLYLLYIYIHVCMYVCATLDCGPVVQLTK